jgi:hypothetical protein
MIAAAVFLQSLRFPAYADPSAAETPLFGNGAAAPVAIGSGTTITLTPVGSSMTVPITLGTAASPYIATIILSDSGAETGGQIDLPISYPATASNPITLEVYDSGTAGTLLHTGTATGIAGPAFLHFVNITGTQWIYTPKGDLPTRKLGAGVQAALYQPANSGSSIATYNTLGSAAFTSSSTYAPAAQGVQGVGVGLLFSSGSLTLNPGAPVSAPDWSVGSSSSSGSTSTLAANAQDPSAYLTGGSDWSLSPTGLYAYNSGGIYEYAGSPVSGATAWMDSAGFHGSGAGITGTGSGFTAGMTNGLTSTGSNAVIAAVNSTTVASATNAQSARVSGTSLNLFGTVADTAHLAGMNNDWRCTFTASGTSGSLVATGGTWNIIGASGTATVTTGTTAYTVASGTTTIGATALSGSVFNVLAPGATILSASNYLYTGFFGLFPTANAYVQAGVNGPWLSCPTSGTGPGGLWCSGTDDYATFQALLNTATNSVAGLTVYIDSDFAVSNTPMLHGNTKVVGVGGHMWHIEPDANEPGVGSVLTGATISSSNIVTQNLWVDCNGPEQSNQRLEGNGFLQGSGTSTAYWVVGGWFGSGRNYDLDLTVVNPCTFSLLWSNLYDSRIKFRNIWTDEEPPTVMASGTTVMDTNKDGPHGWGPDNNVTFHDCDLMGDDDQLPICPVENTPEGGGVGVSGTNIVDARRGNGGPVSNIRYENIFMRNASDVIRLGGQTVASGTAAFENFINNVSYAHISGTTWKNEESQLSGFGSGYLSNVTIEDWSVVSGTSNAGAIICLQNISPAATGELSDINLSDISANDPVVVTYSTGYGLTNIPYDGTQYTAPGGSYFDAVHHLRDGCVAYWRFDTDTSGSTAYDWTGHGATLSNSNGVTYTTGTAWGNAATFVSGSSQCLTLTGTACPNIAAMPECTIAGWFLQQSSESNSPGFFVLMDGTTRQLCIVPGGSSGQGYPYFAPSNTSLYPGGNTFAYGHWVFVCLRRRSYDGKWMINDGGPNGLTATNVWYPEGTPAITGSNPEIILGYDPGAAYFTGQLDNWGVWNRCLTDREVQLLWNPGTDGMPGGNGIAWLWGGRNWPFVY